MNDELKAIVADLKKINVQEEPAYKSVVYDSIYNHATEIVVLTTLPMETWVRMTICMSLVKWRHGYIPSSKAKDQVKPEDVIPFDKFLKIMNYAVNAYREAKKVEVLYPITFTVGSKKDKKRFRIFCNKIFNTQIIGSNSLKVAYNEQFWGFKKVLTFEVFAFLFFGQRNMTETLAKEAFNQNTYDLIKVNDVFKDQPYLSSFKGAVKTLFLMRPDVRDKLVSSTSKDILEYIRDNTGDSHFTVKEGKPYAKSVELYTKVLEQLKVTK